MVKHYALMESLSSNLHDFLKNVIRNLSLPDKKFLRDALIGLIRAGQPVVCRMARQLPNQHTRFLSRLDRLEQHLLSENGFEDKVKEAIPQMWLPLIKDDTPIILDLSDLAKPLAKQMDYLAFVRDGSNGELVNGYWLVEAYASVGHKNPIPILLEPFSHQEPCSPGQNPVVLKAVEKIFKVTGKRGVLIADRGFDSRIMFEEWLDNKYRFVVRLVGKRHLLRFIEPDDKNSSGQWTPVQAGLLAEQIPTLHPFSKVVKHHGKMILRVSHVGWVMVRLPQRDEILTLVVSRIAGEDTPMMLLTNLPVENAEDAKRVLRYYLRRWECEEAICFLKSQVHLERIRTFRWRAIGRLVLLAVLVMMYIGWVIETHLVLAERLIRFGQPLPSQADFLPYRLLTGMTEALNGCFWLRRDLLEIDL
jgi:hypothetical protein